MRELLERIKELERENRKLKEKREYGLIWEDYKEKNETVDYTIEKREELSINNNKTKVLKHKIIEGDNLLALRELQKEYTGKIDVIYIDPPYNTGNEFVYNDRLVDKRDEFKHSKWLSFMSKRLELAKQLLSEEGVIFVSIDDNEQAQLKLLMDSIFGESNFISNVSVINNLSGRSDKTGYAQTHEYKLVYAKNIKEVDLGGFPMGEDYLKEYKYKDEISRYKKVGLKKTGKNSLREDRPNMYYPVYYNLKTNEISLTRMTENDIEILPEIKGKDGRWRWGKETFNKRKDTELVVDKNRDGAYNVYVKMRDLVDGKPRVIKPKTVWLHPSYDTGNGTKLLEEIIGDVNSFDSPKPLNFIKDIFTISTKKDSIILDFFAGSGTTGHAVLELNKEDGGNRQFILCTNNEVSEEKVRNHFYEQGEIEKPNKTKFNKFKKESPEIVADFMKSKEYEELGIARSVTQPRIKKVIEGYTTPKSKRVEGLTQNRVEYYRVKPTLKGGQK